ncbi:hypothetical protein T484DRAFT_1811094, partial [Baffinella frigidus]
AVLDGRDIGTVVWPDAPLKLFVTADADVRAHRRFLELSAAGKDSAAGSASVAGKDSAAGTAAASLSLEHVRAEMQRRDARDSQREGCRLEAAPDALVLDTTSSPGFGEPGFSSAGELTEVYRTRSKVTFIG